MVCHVNRKSFLWKKKIKVSQLKKEHFLSSRHTSPNFAISRKTKHSNIKHTWQYISLRNVMKAEKWKWLAETSWRSLVRSWYHCWHVLSKDSRNVSFTSFWIEGRILHILLLLHTNSTHGTYIYVYAGSPRLSWCRSWRLERRSAGFRRRAPECAARVPWALVRLKR